MEQIVTFFKNPYVIQIIGFIGMGFSLSTYHFKEYNKLVTIRIICELIFGFQFLLLGAYTGMITNFAAVFTNSVYRYRIKKGKSTLVFQILFSVLFVTLGIITWAGPVSLLVIGAKLLSTVAFGIKNTKIIREINMVIQPMWLVYDVIAGSIGGTISDVLAIISLVLAFVRLDIKKKNEQ